MVLVLYLDLTIFIFLDIIASYAETLHVSSRGTKIKLTNDNFVTLWHKGFGHVSKNRIERLVSNGIFHSLDFTNFTIYVECLKGKQTKNKRLGVNKASEVLELIHTNICGPFPKSSWNDQQNFISFIVDYSRYGYL